MRSSVLGEWMDTIPEDTVGLVPSGGPVQERMLKSVLRGGEKNTFYNKIEEKEQYTTPISFIFGRCCLFGGVLSLAFFFFFLFSPLK
jgi:hypothetical protein